MYTVETYCPAYFADVRSIWETAFPNDPPWNRAEVVIPAKLIVQPELFLIAVRADRAIGAALAGYDGHRGWLYSVAVLEPHCRRGVGSMLVREVEVRLASLGCEKVKLQVLSLNLSLLNFYHSLGYSTEDRISMGRHLLSSQSASAVYRASAGSRGS